MQTNDLNWMGKAGAIRVCMTLTILLCMVSTAHGQEMKTYDGDGYRISIPRSWKHQPIQAPNGTVATMFIGSNDFGCTLESSLINKTLMPTMAKATPKQRREFIMADWKVQDWFTIFPNLASTKDFQAHVNTKTTLGKDLPASLLEYSWSNEQGYYRSRTIFTFTSERQFSLVCSGLGSTAEKARQSFASNIGILQKVQHSFSPRPVIAGQTDSTATSWFQKGFTHSKNREYHDAIVAYSKAIEIDPKNAVAYNNRGFAYRQIGQYKPAMDDYDKAIILSEKTAGVSLVYVNRGSLHFIMGQYDRAIKDFNRVIETNPKSIEAWVNRGLSYNKLGNTQRAIESLKTAARLGHTESQNYLTSQGVSW